MGTFAGYPFRIIVPAKAFGEQRARSATGQARPYTPAQTKERRALILACAVHQVGYLRLDVPLDVTIVAGYPMPNKPRFDVPVVKPDWDNVGKISCDALNGTIWRDDQVITDGSVRKRYMATPCCVIIVNRPSQEDIDYWWGFKP